MHSRKILVKPRPSVRFSSEMLQWVFEQLQSKMPVGAKNKAAVIELLREMAELVIWGDQNKDSEIFEVFCEKQMLNYFLQVLEESHGDAEVATQLLQTLYMIMENVRSETTLFYILSSNRINQLIRHEFDFRNEELLAYYISLLKSISLRVNADTIQFFFNETSQDFPLYTSAIAFFRNKDPMVRIAVRTLALSLIKIPNDKVRRFIASPPVRHYFTSLAESLQQRFALLKDLLDQNKSLLHSALVSSSTSTTAAAAATATNPLLQSFIPTSSSLTNSSLPSSSSSSPQPSSTIPVRFSTQPANSSGNRFYARMISDLEQVNTWIGDELYYVHDILSSGVRNIEVLMFTQLIEHCLFQILPSFLHGDDPDRVPSTAQICTAFTLMQVFHIFSYPSLVAAIAVPLLHPRPSVFNSRFPPDFTFSQQVNAEGADNPYRQVLIEFLRGSDRFVMVGVATLYSCVKNPSVSRVLLEEAQLLPARASKSKKLLSSLTDGSFSPLSAFKQDHRGRSASHKLSISPSALSTDEDPLLAFEKYKEAQKTMANSSLWDDEERDCCSPSNQDAVSSSPSDHELALSRPPQDVAIPPSDIVEQLLFILSHAEQHRVSVLNLTMHLLREIIYIPNNSFRNTQPEFARLHALYLQAGAALLKQQKELGGVEEDFLSLMHFELRDWRHQTFDTLLSAGALLLLGHPDNFDKRVSAQPSAVRCEALRTIQVFYLFLEAHLLFFADRMPPVALGDIIRKTPPGLITYPPGVSSLIASLVVFSPVKPQPRSASSAAILISNNPSASSSTPPSSSIASSESKPPVSLSQDPGIAASSPPLPGSGFSPQSRTVSYAESPKPKPVDPSELQSFRESFPDVPKTPPLATSKPQKPTSEPHRYESADFRRASVSDRATISVFQLPDEDPRI
ncbi:MAG: CLEC16A/gop-1 family protein [archaeon]|nr:CLEC16A/gop-1 family protein [archaeon]